MGNSIVFLEPIKSKDLQLTKALEKSLTELMKPVLKQIEQDYAKVVRTWEHKPVFERLYDFKTFEFLFGTDDAIFGYVDGGTRPHIIKPRGNNLLHFRSNFVPLRPRTGGQNATGYRAKTVVGKISSRNSNTPLKYPVAARLVNHPGSEARNFSETIGERAKRKLSQDIQRTFKREFQRQIGLLR